MVAAIGKILNFSSLLKAVASSYGLEPDRSAMRRTQVTLKLSSGPAVLGF